MIAGNPTIWEATRQTTLSVLTAEWRSTFDLRVSLSERGERVKIAALIGRLHALVKRGLVESRRIDGKRFQWRIK